jgi:hypothetical protein
VNPEDEFDNTAYADDMHEEDSELSAFVSAVKEMFGFNQARLAARDWLEESELMDSPPRSISRDWRAVTIAASARVADRLGPYCIVNQPPVVSPEKTDTQASPIPSFNCVAAVSGVSSE